MSNPIERYREAKKRRLEGKFNGAPLFHSFPRLGTLIPAIPRGSQVMLLAGSGTGIGIYFVILNIYYVIGMLDVLYKDSTIYLNRKYEKYLKLQNVSKNAPLYSDIYVESGELLEA